MSEGFDREAWLADRSRSVGGSDAPCILSGNIGVDFDHKFGSIHKIWASKELVRERYGIPAPSPVLHPRKHRRMIQGQESESFCREYVGKVNNAVASECFKSIYRLDGEPNIHGSIDGELHIDGKVIGIEIKTIGTNGEWWWDGVPFRVELQSRHNWYCRPSLDGFMVVALKADNAIWDAVISQAMTVEDGVSAGLIRYDQWMLEPSDFYKEECVPVIKSFWKLYVEGDAIPLADSTDECKAVLEEVFSDRDGETDIDEDMKSLLAEKRDIDEKYKEVKKEKARIRNELMRTLGQNKRAFDEEESVSISVISKSAFDKEALFKDMPELEHKYIRTSTYTKLTARVKR